VTTQPLHAGAATWRADATPADASRATLLDALCFLAALTCVIIYSPAWTAPFTGYQPDASNSLILRLGILPGNVAGLFLFAAAWGRIGPALIRNWQVVVLMGLALASYAWSIDPDATLRRSIGLLLITLGGIGLGARLRIATVAEAMATGFAMIATACFLFGLFIPHWGVMQENFPGAWRGVYLEKNAMGSMMTVATISMLASAIYVPQRRLLWLGFAGLSTALVLLSTSKTALVGLALAVSLMGLIWMVRRGPVFAVLALWAAAMVVAGGFTVFVFAPELALSVVGKDASLTGRTELWAAAWKQLMDHNKWLGFGYGVFWDHGGHWFPAADVAKEAKFTAGHAHNGWLETALGIGLVGVGFFTIYFIQTWVLAAKRMFEGGGAYLVLPFLAVYSLRSLTEVSVLDYQDLLWLLFVAFSVKLSMHEHR
jgi:O-antigen ligase